MPITFRALSALVPDPEGFRSSPPAEPMVSRMSAEAVCSIFSFSDVDEILASRVLSREMVSVVRQGQRTDPASYTWGSRPTSPGFAVVVKAGRIADALESGSTMILESLHRTWPGVGRLCRRLGYEIGAPVSANAYLTPQDSQGFAHHYDTHSVLIVQTGGSKTWQLNRPVLVDPLEHQPFRSENLDEAEWRRLREEAPSLEVTLRPGDTLWIPRGWIHNGFATGEPSLHVSISVASLTHHWIATEMIRSLAEVRALRADVPWGFTSDAAIREDAVRQTQKLVAEALSSLDIEELSATVADKWCRYFLEPVGAPVTSRMWPSEVSMDTEMLTVADAVVGSSWLPGDRLRLHLADRVLTVDSPAAELVQQILAADSALPWCVRDLRPTLDESVGAELASELVELGIARLRQAGARSGSPDR